MTRPTFQDALRAHAEADPDDAYSAVTLALLDYVAELEAQVKGAEDALTSVCRADDKTFDQFQRVIADRDARITELEAALRYIADWRAPNAAEYARQALGDRAAPDPQ